MLKNNTFFDDFAKLTSGAAGSALEFRRELEASMQAKFDQFLANRHLVTREEFDVVKTMAEKARLENERLAAKIEELESKLAK